MIASCGSPLFVKCNHRRCKPGAEVPIKTLLFDGYLDACKTVTLA
jgi:hypothetical protein